ncbi:MAG: PD-(D/E)XK motif protein [Ardenticatenia bacterium]|nr:PD-(D/E)XK motif protein [Ardenticatenia bacterium]
MSRSGLNEYLKANVPAVLGIGDTPVAHLVIDPPAGTIAVRFRQIQSSLPDVSAYRHFEASHVARDGATWCELKVVAESDLLEAYPVLCAVVDRVQLDGLSFHDAVVDALDTYRHLFAGLGRMSEAEEIGLVGETLTVMHLIRRIGAVHAIAAWRGPTAEEHDFGLAGFDLEVKTTTAERPRHWIGDLRQLVPSETRSLWLLSIQVTTGGLGTETLPSMIDRLRTLVTGEPTSRLESLLHDAGWREQQRALYRRSFRLRNRPAAYEVNSSFPAITDATLSAAGLQTKLFPQVRYMIDLSDRPADDPPTELLGFAMELNSE